MKVTPESDAFSSIDDVQRRLAEHTYLADRALATSVFLATRLGKPLYLEGEPGVGKTEVAKTLARILDVELIRLQCYEGLDSSTALYEWNYPRQLLELRLQEARGVERDALGGNLFSTDFLLERPLLRALRAAEGRRRVLLIDEIDRSDEEFEAFLLEFLSDFQVTIPELGPIAASPVPFVVLTSNRTRELHDALKRRCLFHWLDYPDADRELRIVTLRVPDIAGHLAQQVCGFMQWLRRQDLHRRPGIAETIDWAEALCVLGVRDLDADTVAATLGCILKYRRDVERVAAMDIGAVISQRTFDQHVRAPA